MPASVMTRDGVRVLNLNANGEFSGPFVQGADNEPEKATYGTFTFGVAPAATPTDILTLTGAAGKIIRIKSIVISGVSTVAGAIPVALARRSAANTGGTFTALTGRSHDTLDPTPSLGVGFYTANPGALGTLVGFIHGSRLALATASNSVDRALFQYTWQNDKGIVLRSATDILAVNLTGATMPAGTALDFDVLWTEE